MNEHILANEQKFTVQIGEDCQKRSLSKFRYPNLALSFLQKKKKQFFKIVESFIRSSNFCLVKPFAYCCLVTEGQKFWIIKEIFCYLDLLNFDFLGERTDFREVMEKTLLYNSAEERSCLVRILHRKSLWRIFNL